MPAKRGRTVLGLMLFGFLPVHVVQPVNVAQAADDSAEQMPSMAFLEYLGGVEDEVDGVLSSPLELDLEAIASVGSEAPGRHISGNDSGVNTETGSAGSGDTRAGTRE